MVQTPNVSMNCCLDAYSLLKHAFELVFGSFTCIFYAFPFMRTYPSVDL